MSSAAPAVSHFEICGKCRGAHLGPCAVDDEDAPEEDHEPEARPWRDMLKGRRARRLPLAEEQALILRYQRGDKNSAGVLLLDYDQFVRNLSHKIAKLTGAYKVEDDMAQVARMVLWEKMTTYSMDSKARLSSYAFRKILQCMNKIACESLESTRLPRDAVTYAAHRDLEMGMSAEEVKAKHGICDDAVGSLQRTTLPLEAVENLDVGGDSPADLALRSELDAHLQRAWPVLSARERILLALRRAGEDDGDRAERFGVTRYELGLIEREAIRKLETVLRDGIE